MLERRPQPRQRDRYVSDLYARPDAPRHVRPADADRYDWPDASDWRPNPVARWIVAAAMVVLFAAVVAFAVVGVISGQVTL